MPRGPRRGGECQLQRRPARGRACAADPRPAPRQHTRSARQWSRGRQRSRGHVLWASGECALGRRAAKAPSEIRLRAPRVPATRRHRLEYPAVAPSTVAVERPGTQTTTRAKAASWLSVRWRRAGTGQRGRADRPINKVRALSGCEDLPDAGDGDGRLGHVGGDHDEPVARRGRLEGAQLLLPRQERVEWHDTGRRVERV